jgi:hypothetical protein
MVLGARFDPATRCLLEGSDIMNLLPMVMMLIDGSILKATTVPPVRDRRRQSRSFVHRQNAWI